MKPVSRRRFLLGLAASMAPLAALAQSVEQNIRGQLSRQGYKDIEFNRTLLGRIRFVARKGESERELVVTRGGVILRDVTRQIDSNPLRQEADEGDGRESSENGSSVPADDDDDDDGDDNSDDDDDEGDDDSGDDDGDD